MNGFQKKYWQKKRDINQQLKGYYLLSFIISTLFNAIFFYDDTLKILIVKIVVMSMLIMGILSAILDLPSFYIEEDKHNKTEVRFLMIVTPLILYMLLLFGWFDS